MKMFIIYCLLYFSMYFKVADINIQNAKTLIQHMYEISYTTLLYTQMIK